MLPARLNLTLYRGDTWQRTLTMTDTAGNPIDFSGYTALCEFRIDDEAGAVQATATVDITNAATGIFILTLTTTDTATIVDGTWDFQLTLAGVVQSYLYGLVCVVPDTSRP